MNKLVALLVLSNLLAGTALANPRDAAFASSEDRPSTRTSVFVGATYRVGLDSRTANSRERASLKLAGMSYSPGGSAIRFGSGLELTKGKTGKPTLYMAGEDLGLVKTRAGLNGTTTAVVAVVAVAVVAGAVILATNCDNDCDNAKNE